MKRQLALAAETWPIAGKFVIARGARTQAKVLVCTIGENASIGRGECVPYARYGETVESVSAQIEALRGRIESGASHEEILRAIEAGAARNAIDCALWDLTAKRTETRVSATLGIEKPRALATAFTISLGSPDEMAQSTAANAHRPLLKIKLGGDGDEDRLQAVAAAAGTARLIADANEAWRQADLEHRLELCARLGVALVEQPLPQDHDAVLAEIRRPVPVCADESLHVAADIDRLAGRYDAVNIKLDKAGGLTAALQLKARARQAGLQVMVGCMVATSLAMAPAVLLAQDADYVDLDGPLLLASDREPGLRYDGSLVYPPEPELWG